MYGASLRCRPRGDALDRFWQAFEPVHACDEDVFHAARGQFIEQLQVELRAFAFAQPQSEQFLAFFEIDADCNVERLRFVERGRPFGNSLSRASMALYSVRRGDWALSALQQKVTSQGYPAAPPLRQIMLFG
jgi:hypothetical protein